MSQLGQTDFRQLLDLAESGNADAARQLIQQYGPHVVRAIRRHLPVQLRNEFDSVDFAQAVWGSFFTQRDQFDNLEDPEQFMALLAGMARNKVLMEHRKRYATAKRDKMREEEHGNLAIDEQAFAPDPTPSQVAVANDLCQSLVSEYPSRHRLILEQRLQGRTCVEIAELLNMNERSVRRILDRMGRSLLGEEPDES